MIDWIHELCRDWGSYMRKHPKLLPSKNHVWRMWKEQGVSSADFGPSNPEWDVHADILELHQVFRGMPLELSDLMIEFYAKRGAPDKKAKALGTSITEMYELRGRAHYYILGRLGEQKSSGISTPEKRGVALC